MSKLPFVCLNVEPDSDSDSDIDDTAEIQLEEALKLYQNALKLHAQGPASYPEAQKAYEALFKNEIFTYPEALSWSKRQALADEAVESDEDDDVSRTEDDLHREALEGQTLPPTDGVPNSLPQVVYLSFKNFGKFQLDVLRHDLAVSGLTDQPIDQLEGDVRRQIIGQLRKCLETLCDALDKDETDPELWRLVSSLAAILASPRLSRFCLETAIVRAEAEEDGLPDMIGTRIARDELREVCSRLQEPFLDNASSSPVPLQIKKVLNPCSGIPSIGQQPACSAFTKRTRKFIQLKSLTWESLAGAILAQCNADALAAGKSEDVGCAYGTLYLDATTDKKEEQKSRRRLTANDSDDHRQRDARADDTDISLAVLDGSTSPIGTRKESSRGGQVLDPKAVCSPTAATRLLVKTFSFDSLRPENTVLPEKQESEALPIERPNTLKRSPETAGMPQDMPEARARSKRLRARESGVDEEGSSKEMRQQIERQMKPLLDADRHLFNVSDTLLKRLDVREIGRFDELSSFSAGVKNVADSSHEWLVAACSDLKRCLKTWNNNRSNLLLYGTGTGATATLISKGNEAGLASFLEHARIKQKTSDHVVPALEGEDLDDFMSETNASWWSMDELAFAMIIAILGTESKSEHAIQPATSKFFSRKWSPQFKEAVIDILCMKDDFTYKQLEEAIMPRDTEALADSLDDLTSLITLIESIFELHLDVFDAMIKPTSKVDQPTRTLQKARLQRWAVLASQAIALLNSHTYPTRGGNTALVRHLFSMTLHMSLSDEATREQTLIYLQEVRDYLEDNDVSVISLPNLKVMPEISVEAVAQEISRLTTTEFFMNVFNPSDNDPLATIESLEPIIMPVAKPTISQDHRLDVALNKGGEEAENPSNPPGQLLREDNPSLTQKTQKAQLLEFLEKSTASLRLSLFNRLSNAYLALELPSFVFICTIHSMDIILSELSTPIYLDQPETNRSANLFVWIRNLIDLFDKCLQLTISEPTALDCMDDANLALALKVNAACIKLFHVFAIWDDSIRIGESNMPLQQAGGANSFKQAMVMLREMQVKTWRLLYILLREAAVQNKHVFPRADDDFLLYLAAVHSAIGLREYCKLGKKSFLKFLKGELLGLKPADLEEWRYQMAQVAYDLYELRVLADSNTWMTLQEHRCSADQLDRATAREILPMIMAQIQGLSIKDLIKPDRRDFKQAIDKIQDLIGTPKPTLTHQVFNRKQLRTYKKEPIKPSDLQACLKGVGGLTNMTIRNEYTAIAKTGWFFVVGYLRLVGFRSLKRTGPDSTKELEEATTFLTLDIEYDCEKFETWYRLAQVYDSMLDEEVTWTADRINNKMEDLVSLQRQAINCYRMAVALAVTRADDHLEGHGIKPSDVAGTISELYSDFGKRIYASSRPPFDMHAFSLKDHLRWYYTPLGHKFKDRPFAPLSDPAAWLFASVLFRQALVDRPEDWQNWYMLGKCSWKLIGHDDAGGLSQDAVVATLARACEVAPAKDTRHPEKGPILEPHIKLVSAVHKLVFNRDKMSPKEGEQVLARTPYSAKVELKGSKTKKEWVTYVRQILRNLRAADKANWHHRIMFRAAQVANEDDSMESSTEAAISHITPHIFTKTMVIQVWRTQFERAGRHFVYTSRYVKYFVRLLAASGDRVSLEALGKRVRKKHAEFINHVDIWTKICKAHIKLLRQQTHVPDHHEETTLAMLPYEVFVVNAALLQAWAQPAQGEPPSHPLLGALREAIDLKKLNLNLIPNQGIDDLIGDTYARLYEQMIPGLAATATNEKNREAMRVDRILMDADEPTDAGMDIGPLTTQSGRAKIVGRMEVRRRAEALVQRAAIITHPVKGKAAVIAEEAAAREAEESEVASGVPGPRVIVDVDDSELSDLEDEELDVVEDEKVESGDEVECVVEEDAAGHVNRAIQFEESCIAGATGNVSPEETRQSTKPSTSEDIAPMGSPDQVGDSE